MSNMSRPVSLIVVILALGGAFYWMFASVRQIGEEVTIDIHRISAAGVGEKIGVINAEARGSGVLLKPDIKGLEPGSHAFHVHENPSCEAGEKDGNMVAGLAAGGHFDPHGALESHGHEDHSGHDHADTEKPAGDLPELAFDADGVARRPVEVATLTLDLMRGRSIMVHSHAESPDDPSLAKGGGPRVACGVIPD